MNEELLRILQKSENLDEKYVFAKGMRIVYYPPLNGTPVSGFVDEKDNTFYVNKKVFEVLKKRDFTAYPSESRKLKERVDNDE